MAVTLVRRCAPWQVLVGALAAVFFWGASPACAQMSDPVPPSAVARGPEPAAAPELRDRTVFLNQRRIISFRASLLGDTPAERATLGRMALEAALASGGPGQVSRTPLGESVRFEVDGTTVFFLSVDDIAGPRPALQLDAASQDVQRRLQLALAEAREVNNPKQLALGAAYAAAATLVAGLLARLIFVLRGLGLTRLRARLAVWREQHPGKDLVTTYSDHARTAAQLTSYALAWGLFLLVLDLWVTFVLRQFAYTRPWGERSTQWLLEVLGQFALAAASAVPGLVTALLIFLLARVATRTNTAFMDRVAQGDIQVKWIDADTADPTRRLGNVVIWLFALAMAYPYLPGANSEAFKGVTVLAGLMLSLGASSVVGQAMSGLGLMYSKVLRPGEYVKIGDTEGTVMVVGMFATKVHTGAGEEVSLPNAVIIGQPVRNFSRLVEQDGRFIMHTAITIGYATPWRQVHAMLLEAAQRTAGVARDPAPYVVQTALSDFYVEYRLCAQGTKDAPRRRAEAMNQLHGHIQDVFNENSVQIMSPHYIADPAQPQVVPPGEWSSQRPASS